MVYANDEKFEIGKAKIVRKSDNDQVLVVAAGVTLFEALKAADTLAEAGVNIRVMDPFTIKPLDIKAVQDNAAACNGRVITVEDHYPEVRVEIFLIRVSNVVFTDCREVLEMQFWMLWLDIVT